MIGESESSLRFQIHVFCAVRTNLNTHTQTQANTPYFFASLQRLVIAYQIGQEKSMREKISRMAHHVGLEVPDFPDLESFQKRL
jgi:hypothetical protein